MKASGGEKELAERPRPSSYVLQGWGAHQLARAISADSAKESDLGRVFPAQAAELGLSADDCGELGPGEKIRRVAENASSTEQISQFPQAGAQLNLLKLRRELSVRGGRNTLLGLLQRRRNQTSLPTNGGRGPGAVELFLSR